MSITCPMLLILLPCPAADTGVDGDSESVGEDEAVPAAPAVMTKIVLDAGDLWDDELPSSRDVRKTLMGRRVRCTGEGGDGVTGRVTHGGCCAACVLGKAPVCNEVDHRSEDETW